jgi:hypothetical protein
MPVSFSTSGLPSPGGRPSTLQGKLVDATDSTWHLPARKAATMAISTLYLPETTVNIQYQYAPAEASALVKGNVQL